MPTILAFSGSLRTQSFNQKLVTLAADQAKSKGATVVVRHLGDYDLPLFNEDLEGQVLPAGVATLRADMRTAQGFLIASPEYNGFFTPALKNAIDWASRPEEGYPRLDCFQGKVAGLLAASPGDLGGLRGLPRLATLLHGIGALVVPQTTTVSQVHDALISPSEAVLGQVNATVDAVLAQLN